MTDKLTRIDAVYLLCDILLAGVCIVFHIARWNVCGIINTIGTASTINHIVANLIGMSVKATNIGIIVTALPKNIAILDNTMIICTKLACFDIFSVAYNIN